MEHGKSALVSRLGRFVETPVAGELVPAFMPPSLPPEPSIDVLALLEKLSLAERALGRLDGVTMLLPRQELFLYMYLRKEAVRSSQIEGTQSTLSDLLRLEIEAQAGQAIDDIREVSNYVDAMMYGLERLDEVTSRDVTLADLQRLGIVEEITGRKRARVFSYRHYLAILSEGTDPFPTAA